MAMAMSASVTVSIGEEMSGVFSVIFRVRAEVRSYRERHEVCGMSWPLCPTATTTSHHRTLHRTVPGQSQEQG